MNDLSAKAAVAEAAKASCRYYGRLWNNAFPDSNPYPDWDNENDAQREMRVRNATIIAYAYLHYRSNACPALEVERIILLEEISIDWRAVLPEALGIGVADLSPRTVRRAYGHDPRDTAIALPLFATDQRQGAGLLLEAWRREELRRLQEKARLMKHGGWDDHARAADERWRKRNIETFEIVELKLALAAEALQSHDPLASQGERTDA